jgi:hypothetical protein
VITGDGSDVSRADDFEFDTSGSTIDTESQSEGRNVPPGGIPKPEPQPLGPEYTVPPSNSEGMTASADGTYVDYAEPQVGFVQMFPTKLVPPSDVRHVPPGGIPEPEPLPTFAPDTASDVPAGAEQQQPAGNDSNLLDPNLFDPIAPGPTLDTGLFDRITQSPELVNLLNQNPALAEALEQNPAYLDQIEQHLDVGEQQGSIEPSSYTPTDYTDPSLTDPDTAGQDVHEHDDFLEGV